MNLLDIELNAFSRLLLCEDEKWIGAADKLAFEKLAEILAWKLRRFQQLLYGNDPISW